MLGRVTKLCAVADACASWRYAVRMLQEQTVVPLISAILGGVDDTRFQEGKAILHGLLSILGDNKVNAAVATIRVRHFREGRSLSATCLEGGYHNKVMLPTTCAPKV